MFKPAYLSRCARQMRIMIMACQLLNHRTMIWFSRVVGDSDKTQTVGKDSLRYIDWSRERYCNTIQDTKLFVIEKEADFRWNTPLWQQPWWQSSSLESPLDGPDPIVPRITERQTGWLTVRYLLNNLFQHEPPTRDPTLGSPFTVIMQSQSQ